MILSSSYSLLASLAFVVHFHSRPSFRFIGAVLSHLTCPNEKFGPQIQKHVKELFGHELNPILYPILFDQLRVHLDKCFTGQGQQVILNDQNTLFVDNVIFIMKNILERCGKNSVDRPSEHLGAVSIETLMLNIVRYVRHLECVYAVQIKIKVREEEEGYRLVQLLPCVPVVIRFVGVPACAGDDGPT